MQNLPTDTIAAAGKWGDIGDWDVSAVKDFRYAFSLNRDVWGSHVDKGNPKAAAFVGNGISKWNTAAVTTLWGTFHRYWDNDESEMNADLSGWDVAKVTTMVRAFHSTSKFTGTGLASWDTASVTNTYLTFYRAYEMNADLGRWDVAKIAGMKSMFEAAQKFTGTGLDEWNVARVSSKTNGGFSRIFNGATTFNSATSLASCNRRKIADAWKSSAAFTKTTYDTAWSADKCTVRFE